MKVLINLYIHSVRSVFDFLLPGNWRFLRCIIQQVKPRSDCPVGQSDLGPLVVQVIHLCLYQTAHIPLFFMALIEYNTVLQMTPQSFKPEQNSKIFKVIEKMTTKGQFLYDIYTFCIQIQIEYRFCFWSQQCCYKEVVLLIQYVDTGQFTSQSCIVFFWGW